MQEPAPKRRLAAIICADVAGYSRLMGADEAGTFARLKAIRRELINPTVRRNGGRIIKTAGDGLVIEFDSAVAAVRAAVDLQAAMAEREQEHPPDCRILFRVGINLGDIIHERGDVFGDGVNIAARLEQLAEPGTICVSRTVFEQVRDKLAVESECLGERTVKNIARPIETYRLWAGPGHQPVVAAPRWRTPLIAGGIAAAFVVLVGVLWPVLLGRGTDALVGSQPPPTAAAGLSTGDPAPSRHAIAVLPFANPARDPDQEPLADGLTEGLTTQLSRISGLFVIARGSAMSYKDRTARPQDIARDLGVRYVLEGSVRKSGNRLRVGAQLIDTAGARQLWADQYDREASELFALQDDVIARIVSALSLHLTEVEQKRLARIPTTNLEAYDYYLRAERQGSYNPDPDALHRALTFYAKAIDLDPQFADAYAGYARGVVEIWRLDYHNLLGAALARKRAYDAAGQALQLDPDNARAYSVLALLQLGDRRHADAIESARKAVSVKPSDAEAHANLGLVLTYAGQPAEAVAAAEQALRLNPAAPGFRLLAGITFFNARQYERAIEALEAVRAVWPSETVREHLAASYAYAGRRDLATREGAELARLPHNNLALYRLYYDYYKREADLAHHLEGLRRAGIPDWPLGFRGRVEDRVVGAGLEALITSRIWLGREEGGGTFMQQFGPEDRVAYRTAGTLLTGRAHLSDNLLCMSFEGFFLDRTLCGEVYRNAAVANAESEFISITPDALRYFSAKDSGIRR